MDTLTTIDLLRHGETTAGARYCGSTNTELTTRGWTQLQSTVQGMCWDQIISSPLARCARFAHHLSHQHNVPLLIDDRIQELHFGRWEGKTAEELMATSPKAFSRFWRAPFQHTPPEGEALSLFKARVLSAWHDMLTAQAGKKTLIVTHGGVIRILLCHVLSLPVERLLELKVEHAERSRIYVHRSAGKIRYTSERTMQ